MMYRSGLMPTPFDEDAYRKQLEAEKEEKEEKRKHDASKLYRTQVAAKERYENGGCCIWLLLLATIVGGVAHGFMLWGNSWRQVAFTGLGITMAEIKMGVVNMNLQFHCAKGNKYFAAAENVVCDRFLKWNGEQTISSFLNNVCALSLSGACDEISRIQTMSLMVLVGHLWCYLCLLMAFCCGLLYWYKDHQPEWRNRTYAIATLGPFVGIFGNLIYTTISPDLTRLPDVLFFGNMGPGLLTRIFIKAVEAPQNGMNWYGSTLVFFFLLCVALAMVCFFQEHPHEKAHWEDFQDSMEILQERYDRALDREPPEGYNEQQYQQAGTMGNPGMIRMGGGGMVMGPQPTMVQHSGAVMIHQRGPMMMGVGVQPKAQPVPHF